MVCVRLPAVKFKRRVQVTVWAGAFVRFAAFEVPGVSSAFLGTRALSRLRTSTRFQKSNGLGEPGLKLSKVSAANMLDLTCKQTCWTYMQTNIIIID